MTISRSYIIPLWVAAILAAAMLACSSDSTSDTTDSTEEGGKLSVVTSVYPLQYLAQRIGGERVRVVNLTPVGAEPHDWEPAPRNILAVQEADVFAYNGSGLEPWVKRVLNELPQSRGVALNATETLPSSLLEAEEGNGPDNKGDKGSRDPHVWLDPGLYSMQAQLMRDALVRADPEGEAVYSANLIALQEKIAILEQEMEQGLTSCELKAFVTNHAAFGYLANRFGLEQISISGLSPEIEPSPARLRELVKQVEELGIRHIFFETLVSPRVAETLSDEVGAETLELNPLEGLTTREVEEGEDYFTVMRTNYDNLRTALRCP